MNATSWHFSGIDNPCHFEAFSRMVNRCTIGFSNLPKIKQWAPFMQVGGAQLDILPLCVWR